MQSIGPESAMKIILIAWLMKVEGKVDAREIVLEYNNRLQRTALRAAAEFNR